MNERVRLFEPATDHPRVQSVGTRVANVGAGLSLVGVVLVNYFSLVSVLSSVQFYRDMYLADYKDRRTTGAVAVAVLLTLIVIAVVSAVKGGTGARVAAGFTIALGVVGVGVFGLLAASAQQTIDERTPNPPAEAVAGPTCGPEYLPPFFGPDDTFRACDADAEEALTEAQQIAAALTGAPPTVDALRQALSDAGLDLPVRSLDGTRVRAAWGAADIACAVVIGDSTGWHASATEVLMDGGCSDRPAGAG